MTVQFSPGGSVADAGSFSRGSMHLKVIDNA